MARRSSSTRCPPKWSQPPLLVHGAPSTVTWGSADGLRTSPITFQRAGSFTSGGKVATIAWSSPPVRTHCIGSTPTACPMSFIWVGMSIAPERMSIRTLLASAMCPRSAISPSLTSHIAVAPSPAAAGPAWYGGSGRRWASTKARGERKPRESTACPAADQPSQPVTATTSPGWAPARVTGSWLRRSPSAVIGDGDRVAAYDVAADHGGARDLALVAQAVHQLGRPGDREFGRDDQAEQQRGRHGAHGGDVGEVLRGRLAADVVRGGPVPAEVPPLEQDVGARHDPAVGRGHHGGVVAGADPDRRGGGEPGGELPDEPELPQLAHSALHSRTPLLSPSACPVARHQCPRYGRGDRQLLSCRAPRRGCPVAAGLPAASGDAIPWRSFSPHDPRGRPGGSVVQAYILIQTEVGKASTVAETISKIPGVIQAEDVTGPYDVIVRAQADTVDDLGRMVVAKVQQVDGITRTLTCPVVHL